jgi:hypothetical protein
MIRLTLYGRADCHLCDEMRRVVEAVTHEAQRSGEIVLEEVDIDATPGLEAAYGSEVPVLCVNGRKAFTYRVAVDELRARLAAESRSV